LSSKNLAISAVKGEVSLLLLHYLKVISLYLNGSVVKPSA
jgi:hypothetical protein